MAAPETASGLPQRPIPGDYGLPIYGAIKDRLDYFWFQGVDKFFHSRIEKYGSTVFRVNLPPGPPIAKDPRVVCLLDQKSFPTLFDVSKVEKRDVFLGTYKPSLSFNSGYSVCPYLDPSEEKHTKLKQWCFDLIARNGKHFIPEFHECFLQSCATWENDIAAGKKANLSVEVTHFAFNFLIRSVCHHDPTAPGKASLHNNGGTYANEWTLPQLLPIQGNTGLPHPVEEAAFRTAIIPSFVEQSKYDKIHDFITTYGTEELTKAEELGIKRDEAAANLLFFLSFNGYGGFNIFFPEITVFIDQFGHFELMHELHDEVTKAVAKAGTGKVTLQSLQDMPLVRSVVYEGFRYKPPVPHQYGRAKKDFVLESHSNSFQVKKDDMLYGFQPIVMHDAVVFERADEFVPRRFLGPEGEKLLHHVFWSNGRETDKPTVHNKQCPGKNLVVTMSQVYVAELFLRYKDYTIDVEGSGAASKLWFHTLNKA